MINLILIGVLAALVSYMLVYAIRRWAEHHLLDIPNERSSHVRPTPRGGGLAIVCVTLVGSIVQLVLFPTTSWWPIALYVLGAVLIAIISWIDDLQSLSNRIRFATHSLGAILALLAFGYWQSVQVPFLGVVPLGWLGLPLTFLWIVGLTNASNFMDGIDGIAGGQAVVAGLGWAVLGGLFDQPVVLGLGLLLAGSSLGFLGHNWSPARIFLGDVGSAFLGYTFAVLPLFLNNRSGFEWAPLAAALLVWPFLCDTVYTFLRRWRNGENVFAAHRSHLYQRLVIAGYTHRSVSGLYIGLALVGLVLTLAWSLNSAGNSLAIVSSVAGLGLALWFLVQATESRQTGHSNAFAQHLPATESIIDYLSARSKSLRNRYFFVLDVVLLLLVAYLSFALRLLPYGMSLFDRPIETLELAGQWSNFLVFTALVVPAVLLAFWFGGIYRRYWQYASVEEMVTLTAILSAATFLASGLAMVSTWWLSAGFSMVPRSIPFLFLVLALGATATPRLLVRLLAHGALQLKRQGGHSIPVLIIGAGDAGTVIAREIERNPQLGMTIVGFLDDDQHKQGMRIHGIPVLGSRQDIVQVTRTYYVQQVIIAMPAAAGKIIREIVQTCEQVGIKPRIMPGIYELLNGTVSVNQLRNVQIEDLLRRSSVQTDSGAVSNLLQGRRVLITGAGGSIGSELCRQVVRCAPASLVLIGHGENSIFGIHNELIETYPDVLIHALIADIRFVERVEAIFQQHRPEVVLHAAAHKHVPLMEQNPSEAITNNVLGTRNLLRAALSVGVERFIMISTDKAVNPTSIMGVSKRTAELLVHDAAKTSGKPYAAVRFGNVLGSRGSVVLTFKQQIAAGGPVTVTHPEMRRFFMTIPEAVQLVLQAAVLARGGEIFTLDMGEPIKIVDLAHDMITLSGLEVGRDIDIVFSGMRPGEKLYEELFLPDEEYQRTRHEKIFIAAHASSRVPSQLHPLIDQIIVAAQADDRVAVMHLLQALVAEFRPPAPGPITYLTPVQKPDQAESPQRKNA